ncbi:hypothetical protein AeMF1_014061, partial [Aphanomyces euteiches]
MGDHLTVSMVVKATSIARRSPFWIMPSSLLEVQDIVDTIKDEAKALLPLLSSANNPGVVWSGWKKRAKAFLKAYNGLNRRTKWDPVADAKAYITKTQRDVRQGWASQSAMEHAVESYNLLRTEAKTTKTEEAFKIHRTQSFYKALDRDGTLQTSKEGIDLAFHQHWSEIMRSDGRDTPLLADSAAYALKLQSKLSTEAKESLDFPITIHELAESIRAMAPEKSPGMDGFTAKFYQLDPLLFGKILHIVFNYQLQRGELLKFQRQSATALLYKSGATWKRQGFEQKLKKFLQFRTWSFPNDSFESMEAMCTKLSLQCESHSSSIFRYTLLTKLAVVETKILSKALAYRLGQVLPSVIHPDQQGFVKGRLLHDHVVLLQELQHRFTKNNVPAFATFLDFEKAYDRVDWNYLVMVMEAVGIGPRFIQWFRLLYNKTSTKLIIN